VLIPAVQVMDKDLNLLAEAAILKLGYSIDFSRRVVVEDGRVYVAGMIHLDPQGAPSVIPVLYIVALRETGAPKAATVTQTVLQTVTARETVTMTTLETVTVERIVEREKTVTAFPRPRCCRGLGWPLAWAHLLHPSLMGPCRAQRHWAPI